MNSQKSHPFVINRCFVYFRVHDNFSFIFSQNKVFINTENFAFQITIVIGLVTLRIQLITFTSFLFYLNTVELRQTIVVAKLVLFMMKPKDLRNGYFV